MDLSPFKLDIDELINEFAEGEWTNFSDMKRIWLSRKFTYIYEASPSTNLAFFMQSLYAHAIGHMVSSGFLSCRLGGLYCLYCLYETQPFNPPFKIYLSLGELKRLKDLVVDAKERDIKVVIAVVKRMLEKNMFLFGLVDINEDSVTERVNEFTELQNAHVQVAYNKLLANTRIEHFLQMDMGAELDLNALKRMSTEYAKAKELAIKEAGEVVDVQDIKHISENQRLIGEVVGKFTEDWNAQKDAFYKQTGIDRCHANDRQLQLLPDGEEHAENEDEEQNIVEFDKELEQLLCLP